MLVKQLKNEDIKLHAKDLNYYIIYYFDRLEFGEGNKANDLDIENINEAFFFNENMCLHVYREDGVKGILYIYENSDEVISEEQIAKKGKEFKALKSLLVNKFINYDEDRQAYIERVLPSKLIFR
ncbi:MAG TPA: hypothetical protein VIL05_08490 [Thermoclostridium sp.]